MARVLPVVCVLLCIINLLLVGAQKVRYDNYVHVEFDGEKENLANLRKDALLLEERDGARFITGKSFLLPPVTANRGARICSTYGLTCRIATNNFQAVLDWEEKINNVARKAAPKVNADISYFTAYHNLTDTNNFVISLQNQFPQLVLSRFSIGKSVQGRDIWGISFTGLKNRGTAKPTIIYNAGQHAREWISPPTVLFIAYALLSNYSTNNDITTIMDNFEWVIIPVLNPDGYEYTWTTDRMWRKNRRVNSGSTCLGVDNNRNWDYQWLTGGSSTNPCSETYAGPRAFSEPEETLLATYIQTHGNVKGYIDYHAAAYVMLNPYGFTSRLCPDNTRQWALALAYVQATYLVHGKSYDYGTIMNLLYQANGSSVDYVYAALNVPYVYTIELREGSPNVFILPPAQIIPQGQEMLAGVIAMAKYITANPDP